MKQTVWGKNWLVTALVCGVMALGVVALRAQDEASTNAPGANVTTIETVLEEADTNAPTVFVEEEVSDLRHGPVVVFGGTARLKAGERAEAVIGIFGNARAEGKVREAVVAIGGDAVAKGDVGEAVVAIGGNSVASGNVGDAVVAILGDAEVQGKVGDAVVAVLGDVRIGSNAVVEGDVVAVGGKITVEPGGKVEGELHEVGVGGHPFLAPLIGAADWFKHCILKLRLIAPSMGWFWIVVGIFLLFYLLIAVALPRPVANCMTELNQRPATTFLLGLLTFLLIPVVSLILMVTGIGILVMPFVMAAVFIGAAIGKVALFQYLGRVLVRMFGNQVAAPVVATLVGFTVITLLYMVPILSLLVYMLVGLWGTGIAVTAAFGGARKETAPPSGPTAPQPPTGASPIPPMNPVGTSSFYVAGNPPPASEFSQSASVPGTEASPRPESASVPPAPDPVIAEAFTYPRASFWERAGAAFLDVILVSVLVGFIAHSPLERLIGPPITLLVAVAYFGGMWAWKGTTIGGIVLGLKVVRLDGKPVSPAVAIVRSLGAFFSFIVLLLGFLWIAFDRDKQSWHDKIAGTVVVRMPRGMSLL